MFRKFCSPAAGGPRNSDCWETGSGASEPAYHFPRQWLPRLLYHKFDHRRSDYRQANNRNQPHRRHDSVEGIVKIKPKLSRRFSRRNSKCKLQTSAPHTNNTNKMPFCFFTPSRLQCVSTIAPIMATSRIIPAAWNKYI